MLDTKSSDLDAAHIARPDAGTESGLIPPNVSDRQARLASSARRMGHVGRYAAVLMAVLLAAGLGAAACGSSPTTAANTIVVKAPDFVLSGCTYVLDGTIPAGEPDGVQPHFSKFSPDSSATAALEQIKAHGGTALVNGFMIPGGTRLYAGPDTSQPSVGTIPSNYAILAAEPVIWKDASGDTWVAFFVSCGGSNLYWMSLKQVEHQNPQAAGSISPFITEKSLEPITVTDQNFAWKSSNLNFIIGRGELFGPVA